MVVPGTIVIVLFSLGYGYIRQSAVTGAALRGAVAGVAGMGLYMAYRLLSPQLKESATEGRVSLAASISIFVAAAAGFFLLPGVPVVLIFLAAGAGMVLVGFLTRRMKS